MAHLSEIARPYAQAAYEFADAQQALAAWDAMLKMAAEITQHPALHPLLSNDRISAQQWFSLLSELLKPTLDAERKNFLRIITENKRVAAFPEIFAEFKEYEALNNKACEVQVTTAVALDAKQQQRLIAQLSKRLNYQVSLRCEIDPNILGGALVRAGDKVIDGTVRGQLTRLLEFAIR